MARLVSFGGSCPWMEQQQLAGGSLCWSRVELDRIVRMCVLQAHYYPHRPLQQ